MRRREFLSLVGPACIGWPLSAWAQQSSMPVVGFLSSRSEKESQTLLAAFREGLRESGYVEGRNVLIEYRWADGDYHKLKAFAGDLVARRAAVIATGGGASSGRAAKAVTNTIPIVLTGRADPVAAELVKA